MKTIFIDGACEPYNPGGYGACAMICYDGPAIGEMRCARPVPFHSHSEIIGHGPGMTNNVAEWRGLRGTLKWITTSPRLDIQEEFRIFMDSQLVVSQFNQTWKCNSPVLQVFKEECYELRKLIPDLTVTWVPRDMNWVADNMINELYASNNIQVTVRHRK